MCPALLNPRGGFVISTARAVGSVATYMCDRGFNLIGNVARTCQGNFSWSGEEPHCGNWFVCSLVIM